MSVTNAPQSNGLGDDGDALAEVRAAGTTTRYMRAGNGRPVLLLCDCADDRFPLLFGALAGSYRVIAPVQHAGEQGACMSVDCLAAFIEGLGLTSVPIVAAGPSSGPASALARLHRDRIDRLVLLGLDVGEAQHHVEAALEALARGD